MIRKVSGWSLFGLGLLGCIVLLTYGGPVLPHIVGPAALALVGAGLVWIKGRG
jgi:hypothetical protein